MVMMLCVSEVSGVGVWDVRQAPFASRRRREEFSIYLSTLGNWMICIGATVALAVWLESLGVAMFRFEFVVSGVFLLGCDICRPLFHPDEAYPIR